MSNYEPRTYGEGEFASLEDLNQISSNIQYLFENSVRGRYIGGSARIDKGIKIMGGRLGMGKTKANWLQKTVLFGNFFTPGIIPLVVVSPISSPSKTYASVRGIGTLYPTHVGFQVIVSVDRGAGSYALNTSNAVSWIALGY